MLTHSSFDRQNLSSPIMLLFSMTRFFRSDFHWTSEVGRASDTDAKIRTEGTKKRVAAAAIADEAVNYKPVSRYGRGLVLGSHEKATVQVPAATLQFSSTSI